MSTTEQPPSAPPPSGGGPSLEAQVVRLGLMTPDEVATTMREEAETGRPFAELALQSGRLKAEDLTKLTGEPPKPLLEPAPAERPEPVTSPVSLVPDPDPDPEPEAEADPEPEPEVQPLDQPATAVTPEPEPHVDETSVLEAESHVAAEVFVCLTSGERIAAGSFDEQSAAEQRARELMGALDGSGEWPRLDGRFIRPDAVVSIDVELDEQ